MFLLGIKENYKHYYQELINSITPMPIELFLHLLCMVNYYISNKKRAVSEILLYDCYSKIHAQETAAQPLLGRLVKWQAIIFAR